jgi:Ca-activated chloride channel family protein
MFYFSNPKYLFILLVIPLLLFIHFFSLSNRKKHALDFANFDSISRIQGIDFFSKNMVSLFLTILVVVLLTFSAAGLTVQVLKKSSSFSFVIAIDSSQSMEANDIIPNRLEAAKETSIGFVNTDSLRGNIGVVSFSGNTKIESSLTDNKDVTIKAIREITISNFGGTDIYDLVMTSTNLLENEGAKSIIIFSDGQNNVGQIEDAIKYANNNNVIIHTIGVGTKEGGMTSYALSKLDEDSLKSLAYNTNGKYFSVTNKGELSNSLSEIFGLTEKKVFINLTIYLILASFILIFIDFFLRSTRYSEIF